MKDIRKVIADKELEFKRVSNELRALQIALKLLDEEEQSAEEKEARALAVEATKKIAENLAPDAKGWP